MSKESLEHLSSLMDGELSREAGQFLTRRLFNDEAMCEKWERYHLIRDCIRQPGSKQIVTGLSVRLNASLLAEDGPGVPAGRFRRWLKPVSGIAVAASVALLAIMVTAPQPGQVGGENDMAIAVPANKPFVSPNTVAARQASQVSQAVSYSPAQQVNANRLNAYLLRHNQMARTAGRQGFVSFVPIVATPVAVPEDGEDRSEPANGPTELETAERQ